ncbi:MAG: hypothetical protein PVJ76_21565 [Gemmatimonadota bacterium]
MDSAEDLTEAGLVIQFGVAPNRIDLVNSIDDVDFSEAWDRRVTVMMATEDECPIHFIGLEALIRNKVALSRPKDLDDLQYLRFAEQNKVRRG